MDTTEIKRKLKNSLEISHIRGELLATTIACVLGAGFAVLSSGKAKDIGMWIASGVMFGLIYIPILAYSLWRIFRVFRRAEACRFYRCRLSQPHSGRWHRAMYFTVVLEEEDGATLVRDTHAIFYTHGIVGPLLEDYVNQMATVAYNEETEEVIVIG